VSGGSAETNCFLTEEAIVGPSSPRCLWLYEVVRQVTGGEIDEKRGPLRRSHGPFGTAIRAKESPIFHASADNFMTADHRVAASSPAGCK
jgi:hypothetical protein